MKLAAHPDQRHAFLSLFDAYWQAHPYMSFIEVVESLPFGVMPIDPDDEVIYAALARWRDMNVADQVFGADRCEQIGSECGGVLAITTSQDEDARERRRLALLQACAAIHGSERMDDTRWVVDVAEQILTEIENRETASKS